MAWCILLLVALTLYWLYSDGFSGDKIDDIKNHKELFINGNMKSVKTKLDWIDPIDYYDIKKTLVNGGDVYDLMSEPK